MRIATAIAVLACLALATQSRAEDAVSLKWNLKEGDTFYSKSVADMDITMTLMDKDVDLTMKVTTVQRFKVVSAKPGATKVEMVVLSMKVEAKGLPAGTPGLDDIGERVQNTPLTATLNDDMEVTKLEGYEKFLDKLADGDEKKRKQLKGQFSETSVSQMVSQVFSFVPKNAVKVGDTWTSTTKIPAGGLGDATVKQKFKLDSLDNGSAKITIDGDLTFKEGDGTLPGLPEGVKISKFNMKADKYKGTILFDTKLGRMKESKLNMDLAGSITLSAGVDIEVKMKIKSLQTTTVTEKNPTKD
jgi:hypothetical protein